MSIVFSLCVNREHRCPLFALSHCFKINLINIRYIVTYYDMFIYMHCDTQNVLSDIRNTAYWIVINKSLNETTKSNLKNTLIQYWYKVFLKLLFVASFTDLYIYIYIYEKLCIYIYICMTCLDLRNSLSD